MFCCDVLFFLVITLCVLLEVDFLLDICHLFCKITNHIRYLSKKYNIPNPLDCLNSVHPAKQEFKEYIHTKISSFFETSMRKKAKDSSSMKYLNVSLTGLRGKKHPVLSGVFTTHEVKKSKIHIKMFARDYLTYEMRAKRSGGSPHFDIHFS